MGDKQLVVLYTIVFILWGGTFAFFNHISQPLPDLTPAQEHADKLCQALYGPQTAAHWADGQMACITVRGEVVPVKQP
jgi:predicted MFS family arabinose efflux permease